MKRFLKQSLKLFALPLAIIFAFTLNIGTAQAQELPVAGSTLNSRFDNGTTSFNGLVFSGDNFSETTSGGELRLVQGQNLGTFTFNPDGIAEANGSFRLEVFFNYPSGFSANPIIVYGEVFVFGSDYDDPSNFAFINFPNNSIPVSFSGVNGTGVFSLALDDVCFIDGEPCSSDYSEGTMGQTHKSGNVLAFSPTRGGGNVRWLITNSPLSMFATNSSANKSLTQSGGKTITIPITATIPATP